MITPAPGGARGMSCAIYPADHGKSFQPEVAGQLGLHFDEDVRTAHGWCLRSRRHVLNAGRDSVPALAGPEARYEVADRPGLSEPPATR